MAGINPVLDATVFTTQDTPAPARMWLVTGSNRGSHTSPCCFLRSSSGLRRRCACCCPSALAPCPPPSMLHLPPLLVYSAGPPSALADASMATLPFRLKGVTRMGEEGVACRPGPSPSEASDELVYMQAARQAWLLD